ncbi:hypothetical protein CYLTODRAFT_458432 [Cylindrobasidium torrendii FP15055 ss-10]|uniref:Uncharacterized protein n=1 Tax=Cylindrobasidium torrendii FP15055 ss-10 TaxID=1314674 RepID=A0A0D7AXI1_9AGAR|nr:hypothetical protein CYLTODRAFT_458432 [Cylindrobasidium torrendii FP15055 ss-10]
MATLYRSYDISTHPSFEDPVKIELLSSSSPRIRTFEYGAGLRCGEFNERLNCKENILKVQPRVARTPVRFAFVPVDSVLQEIFDLFENNFQSLENARIPFVSVKSFKKAAYTFEPAGNCIDPLFTRHPVTGLVTKHDYPYPRLPLFTMTAHCCLAIFRAFPFYAYCTDLGRPRTPQSLLLHVRSSLNNWTQTIPKSFGQAAHASSSDATSLVNHPLASSYLDCELPKPTSRVARRVRKVRKNAGVPMDVDMPATSKPAPTASRTSSSDSKQGYWREALKSRQVVTGSTRVTRSMTRDGAKTVPRKRARIQ